MQSGQINESGRAGIQSLRFQRGQLEFGVVELGRQSLNRGGERGEERERERERGRERAKPNALSSTVLFIHSVAMFC